MVLIAILVAVLDRVLRHREVTIQTLYGAMSAYFLLGLIFAAVYGGMDAASSTPIFGDYTVKTNLGRRIVAIEAIMGQLFLATTLARLVSMYRSTPTPAPPDEDSAGP
jgi:hypothetical protein